MEASVAYFVRLSQDFRNLVMRQWVDAIWLVVMLLTHRKKLSAGAK